MVGEEAQKGTNPSICVFLHLFICMEVLCIHFVFSLFVPLGHLGVGEFPSTLHHEFQQLDCITSQHLAGLQMLKS